jgi:predicted nucleic acid-binding protein
MLLADSSVWIDFFNGVQSPESLVLEANVRVGTVYMGDLIAVEVLQGIDKDREFERIRRLFLQMEQIQISDGVLAVEAARNYRRLRALGITVRKTIDTLIATRCIIDGHALLFSDRDYQPFVDHLGLVSAMGE